MIEPWDMPVMVHLVDSASHGLTVFLPIQIFRVLPDTYKIHCCQPNNKIYIFFFQNKIIFFPNHSRPTGKYEVFISNKYLLFQTVIGCSDFLLHSCELKAICFKIRTDILI